MLEGGISSNVPLKSHGASAALILHKQIDPNATLLDVPIALIQGGGGSQGQVQDRIRVLYHILLGAGPGCKFQDHRVWHRCLLSWGDNNGSKEDFKRILKFERNAGFCLDIVILTTSNNCSDGVDGSKRDWKEDKDVLLKFLQRMATLVDPTKLGRAARNGKGSRSD